MSVDLARLRLSDTDTDRDADTDTGTCQRNNAKYGGGGGFARIFFQSNKEVDPTSCHAHYSSTRTRIYAHRHISSNFDGGLFFSGAGTADSVSHIMRVADVSQRESAREEKGREQRKDRESRHTDIPDFAYSTAQYPFSWPGAFRFDCRDLVTFVFEGSVAGIAACVAGMA